MLHAELIDRVTHDEHFDAKLLVLCKQRALHDGLLAVAWQEIDSILSPLHSADILVQACQLIVALSAVEPTKELVLQNLRAFSLVQRAQKRVN